MQADNQQVTPYFRNGLLYFPEKTIHALLNVGLDWRIAHAAARGIALDDGHSLAEIQRAIEVLLLHVPPSSALYEVLNSDETRFMLTGKPLRD